ncbi:MAG: bifunctional diguanylate cyclase/phosphodiesterase [Sphingorhabdus sp.]
MALQQVREGLTDAGVIGQADFAWLDSLPIAAAIFRQSGDNVQQVSANNKFREVQFTPSEGSLALTGFAARVNAMRDEGRDNHFECWHSPDEVNRREFEINIGRFGEAGDHFLLTLIDRTAEALSRINLRREMMSDSLTGFYNRVGFEEEIEDLLAADRDSNVRASEFAILILDLARFSRVNESVGAMAGDELIITVARRLNSRTRDNEILARLGGNEFALFVKLHEGEKVLPAIAGRLVEAFDQPCQLSNLEIKMECAVGAAIGQIDGDDPTDTLRHAQVALKRAKASKKFELYSQDVDVIARHRFSIETDLRRALQRDELELYYQPLIDLESGMLSGFEALARWQHADHGFVSPVDFIPVAEESGLIVPLGRWAMREAATTLAGWDHKCGEALPLRISVNMSAVQMQHDDVPLAVEEAVRSAKICGNRITLELTESAFVSDPDGAKKTLHALKDLNIHLAMDDFGTGYSNLAYLQQLPIDVLKIDRSFITDMIDNKDKTAIVRTILSLADALGMRTTAEGVETLELSNTLKGFGCSVGQGYYYAKPLTATDAFAYIEADRASRTA